MADPTMTDELDETRLAKWFKDKDRLASLDVGAYLTKESLYRPVPWVFLRPPSVTSMVDWWAEGGATALVDLNGDTLQPRPNVYDLYTDPEGAWVTPVHGHKPGTPWRDFPVVWGHSFAKGCWVSVKLNVVHRERRDGLVLPSSKASGSGTPLMVRVVRDQWCPSLHFPLYAFGTSPFGDYAHKILEGFGCSREAVSVRFSQFRESRQASVALGPVVPYGVEYGDGSDSSLVRFLYDKALSVGGNKSRKRSPMYFHSKYHRAVLDDESVKCPACEVCNHVEWARLTYALTEKEVMDFYRPAWEAEGKKWSVHGLPDSVKDGTRVIRVWGKDVRYRREQEGYVD